MKQGIKYIILLLLLTTSCAPRRLPPVRVTEPARNIEAAAGSDTPATAPDMFWWRIFGDTVLNQLVETALVNNRDARTALSRIVEARYRLAITRAQFLPQFSASAQGGATYEDNLLGHKSIVQEYFVQPGVSWEISLFGKWRYADEASRAQLLSTQWAYRSVLLSLAAEVARTYFTLLQYTRSLDITRSSFSLREQEMTIIDSLHSYGMTSAVDLEQARSQTASAAADIPLYERAVRQTNYALNVLLGENPRIIDMPRDSLPLRASSLPAADSLALEPPSRLRLLSDTLPPPVPAGLPSQLLERRPDVIEAWYTMAAAAAQVNVAHAERYPSISLTGQGGILSTSVRDLFRGNPFAWSASLSLTEPLFSFGRLKREEQAAGEAYRQAMYEYEQTVLTAFSDVETALNAIETYARQEKRYAQLIDANRKIRMMNWYLYRDGMTDYLQVIDAERNLYSSLLEYVQTQSDRLSAYTDLYKALGGGWDGKEPVYY